MELPTSFLSESLYVPTPELNLDELLKGINYMSYRLVEDISLGRSLDAEIYASSSSFVRSLYKVIESLDKFDKVKGYAKMLTECSRQALVWVRYQECMQSAIPDRLCDALIWLTTLWQFYTVIMMGGMINAVFNKTATKGILLLSQMFSKQQDSLMDFIMLTLSDVLTLGTNDKVKLAMNLVKDLSSLLTITKLKAGMQYLAFFILSSSNKPASVAAIQAVSQASEFVKECWDTLKQDATQAYWKGLTSPNNINKNNFKTHARVAKAFLEPVDDTTATLLSLDMMNGVMDISRNPNLTPLELESQIENNLKTHLSESPSSLRSQIRRRQAKIPQVLSENLEVIKDHSNTVKQLLNKNPERLEQVEFELQSWKDPSTTFLSRIETEASIIARDASETYYKWIQGQQPAIGGLSFSMELPLLPNAPKTQVDVGVPTFMLIGVLFYMCWYFAAIPYMMSKKKKKS